MIQSSYPSAIRMNFVFCNNPWIMPPEPDIIRDIFVRRGTVQHFPAGTRLTHGGVAGSVYFVNKGLVTFGYFDASAVFQVLNIILPGRTVGDLDSLSNDPCTIIAECVKPCVLSVLTKEEWQDAIRSTVQQPDTSIAVAPQAPPSGAHSDALHTASGQLESLSGVAHRHRSCQSAFSEPSVGKPNTFRLDCGGTYEKGRSVSLNQSRAFQRPLR